MSQCIANTTKEITFIFQKDFIPRFTYLLLEKMKIINNELTNFYTER